MNSDDTAEMDPATPSFDIVSEADNQQPAAKGYQVLARKYRPQNFTDLVGQEAMVQTLRNAFQFDRIAHAFMLTGVRGVGKTTTARILARALNYQSGARPSDGAPSMALETAGVHCASIMAGTHIDVMEIDAASHTGIDDIRDIIDSARYNPSSARFKVYIIDEVHMLSTQAFNGLLKTLEEPPAHVKFIFATTEIRKVPVTVLSRCQRFDLRRLERADTLALLQRVTKAEGMSLAAEALELIARAAEGSARDALSLLDRVLAHGGDDAAALDGEAVRGLLGLADRTRVFDLLDHVMRGRIAEALEEFGAQFRQGADPARIIADLMSLTHWLTRLKFVEGADADIAVPEAQRQRGQAFSSALPTDALARAWQVLLRGQQEVLQARNDFAAAEMVLIRLAHLADMPTPGELVRRYEQAQDAPAAEKPPAAPEKQQDAPAAEKPPAAPEKQQDTPPMPQAQSDLDAAAQQDPLVQAALAQFPDARVLTVSANAIEPAAPEDDAATG